MAKRCLIILCVAALLLGLGGAASAGPGPQGEAVIVLINELDSDTPSTDVAEFIELYDGGVGNTPLDGLVLVFYNGSNDLSYYAIDLDGYSTDADGYFLAGNAGVVPAPSIVFAGNLLQNGQDAVALYTGDAASFPNDTPVSVLNIIDALVYDTNDADDPGLLVLLDAGQPQVDESSRGNSANDSNQRCANGSGGPRNTSTYAQWAPTPGVTNECIAPPAPVAIHDIQGLAHRSLYTTQRVRTSGIVTVLSINGFWMQDPSPDAYPGTSEGVFVYTGGVPGVAVGDSAVVTATVSEYYGGGYSSGSLSLTELVAPTVAILSHTNPLPAPVPFGPLGSAPPTEIIEDDATGDVETTGVFDPEQDGIDYYESLEGMRIEVNNAVVVGPTNSYGEIPVLGDNGVGQGLRSERGGIVLRATDANPERIILDDVLMAMPQVQVGDVFTHVLGVLDYKFGNFKLLATEHSVPQSGGLEAEIGHPQRLGELAIATLNTENLDVGDGKFDTLARQIVDHLRAPDILALQEIQDNSGPADDGVTDAADTYNGLIASITNAGGPAYEYRDIAPTNNEDGGELGGNIRVGFLFRPDRVTFVERPGGDATTPVTVTLGVDGPELSLSPGRIDPTNAAFVDSRKPLAAEFEFMGQRVFVIANHFNSKGGDSYLFGRVQPPVLVSEAQRNAQATVVNNFVKALLTLDTEARIVVLGDLNDFQFSVPMSALVGTQLTNLVDELPEEARYTYVYDGNSQALDHILVSSSLVDSPHELDIVHLNAEFADAFRPTDHDPVVARLALLPHEVAMPVMTRP